MIPARPKNLCRFSAFRIEEQDILPSFRRHEDDDEDDDVRPGQEHIEVSSMIYDNGSHFNADGEPDSRVSIDLSNLGTEETHIPSNIDEDVI